MASYQQVSRSYHNVHPDDDTSSDEEDNFNYSDDADDQPFTPVHRPTSNPASSYFPKSSPNTQRTSIRQNSRPYNHIPHHDNRRATTDPGDEGTRLVHDTDRRTDRECRRERNFARDNRNSNETGNRSEGKEDGHVVSFRISQQCVSKWLLVGFIVTIVVGLLVAVIILFVNNDKGHQGECVLRPEHCDPWTAWSGCSVTCGTGVQTRTRNCYGNSTHPWESDFTDSLFCSEQLCIGTWSTWGSWSQCGATCGCGLRSRDRTCSMQICEGDKSEYELCQLPVCFTGDGYTSRPWEIETMLLLIGVARISSQFL